ncbi:MAG: LSM domain-containing protein [Candidatus Thorarchaeota archaeon]|jgi:small nuclear ribonucleoprotein
MNAGRPMELLQKSIGAQVLVELKGKRKIKGRLRGFDQHLNLILEDADEIAFDSETNEDKIEQVQTVVVRGDNVVIVSPPPKAPKKNKPKE